MCVDQNAKKKSSELMQSVWYKCMWGRVVRAGNKDAIHSTTRILVYEIHLKMW